MRNPSAWIGCLLLALVLGAAALSFAEDDSRSIKERGDQLRLEIEQHNRQMRERWSALEQQPGGPSEEELARFKADQDAFNQHMQQAWGRLAEESHAQSEQRREEKEEQRRLRTEEMKAKHQAEMAEFAKKQNAMMTERRQLEQERGRLATERRRLEEERLQQAREKGLAPPTEPVPGTAEWEAARQALENQILTLKARIEADPADPELHVQIADISHQLALLHLFSSEEETARRHGQVTIAHMEKARQLYSLRRETKKVQRVQQQLDRLKQVFGIKP